MSKKEGKQKKSRTPNSTFMMLLKSDNKFITIGDVLHIKRNNVYEPISDCELRNIIQKKLWEVESFSLSKHIVEDLSYLLKSEVIVSPKDINPRDSYNFLNGELKIVDGKACFGEHKSYFTFSSNIEYNESIDPDIAKNYLKTIIPSEKHQAYILEGNAVALFPVVRDYITFDDFYINEGHGENGKSVLYEDILPEIFGRKAVANLSLEDISEKFALHGLIGKRINISTEIDSRVIKENRYLKSFTSGDTITVNRKHLDALEANINAVSFLCTNRKLIISSEISTGMKRRLKFIKFPNKFVEESLVDHKKGLFLANPEMRIPDSKICREVQQSLVKLIVLKAEEMISTRKKSPHDYEFISDRQIETSHHRSFVSKYYVFDRKGKIPSSDVFEDYKTYCDDEGFFTYGTEYLASRWDDPVPPYDKATRVPYHLTRKLLDLYPDDLTTGKSNDVRCIYGITYAPRVKARASKNIQESMTEYSRGIYGLGLSSINVENAAKELLEPNLAKIGEINLNQFIIDRLGGVDKLNTLKAEKLVAVLNQASALPLYKGELPSLCVDSYIQAQIKEIKTTDDACVEDIMDLNKAILRRLYPRTFMQNAKPDTNDGSQKSS